MDNSGAVTRRNRKRQGASKMCYQPLVLAGLLVAGALFICTRTSPLLLGAFACSIPPQGCTKDKCLGLRNVPKQTDPRVGYWLGQFPTAANKALANRRGGPFINYEIYKEVGDIVKGTKATTLSQCCFDCARTNGCWMYQFFDSPKLKKSKRVANFYDGVQCYLLRGGSDFSSNKAFGSPYAGSKSVQATNKNFYDPSWLGGLCNGNASVVDDPHFVGAMGTHFDFNGQLDKSFCLATDQRLQVNILLRGYEDQRTQGATKQPNGKAIRSWIKEVGVLWKDASNVEHHAHLVARNGKQQERGDGFLASLYIDGVKVETLPSLGEAVTSDGGFVLHLTRAEKKGMLDMDVYSLRIAGLAKIELKMRVAHPSLQSPEDAQAHFNLHFASLKSSSKMHGVLGQTYRTSTTQMIKALEYSILQKLMKEPLVADGENGKGFLEGTPDDYITSSILAADCKFSNFKSSQVIVSTT